MNDRFTKDLQSMRISVPQPRTIFRFGIAWFVFCAVLGLGTFVAVACVAWHFLAKVW